MRLAQHCMSQWLGPLCHTNRYVRENNSGATSVSSSIPSFNASDADVYERFMSQKVAVFVYGAPLDQCLGPHQANGLLQSRRAIDDDEARRLQTARDQIVKQTAPGSLAFTTHVAPRQQNLLAITPYAQRHQQRNRRRFAVEPHPDHRAIQDETDNILVSQRTMTPWSLVLKHRGGA